MILFIERQFPLTPLDISPWILYENDALEWQLSSFPILSNKMIHLQNDKQLLTIPTKEMYPLKRNQWKQEPLNEKKARNWDPFHLNSVLKKNFFANFEFSQIMQMDEEDEWLHSMYKQNHEHKILKRRRKSGKFSLKLLMKVGSMQESYEGMWILIVRSLNVAARRRNGKRRRRRRRMATQKIIWHPNKPNIHDHEGWSIHHLHQLKKKRMALHLKETLRAP